MKLKLVVNNKTGEIGRVIGDDGVDYTVRTGNDHVVNWPMKDCSSF